MKQAVTAIVQVNLKGRLAITNGGEVIPITNLLDEDGNETDDVSECRGFVAGPTRRGLWVTDFTENFDLDFTERVH